MAKLVVRSTLLYLVGVNTTSAVLVGYDKRQAAHRGQRVPERRLCNLAIAGGWAGGMMAMYLARHKTKKKSFQKKYMNAVTKNAMVMLPAALVAFRVPQLRGAFSSTFSSIASNFSRRPPPRNPPRFRR
ncbi:hypothetical protein BWQ96_07640 [Gracilariopsis chorda]|uniref:Uncharacterized protein n=1 Tax=Gracilariopsis chorda TaxID=448386 RepID=A0A2V3IKL2_9FLOR|nr:hypothetical protein BWQ96_07640 [Gracilariopsis chorda]|eukprot:PXF42636.1 hypothetical protein BWQ96_07640 [Gracilariopsis chorda]